MYQISFDDEIIVDNFAGGGGASTGIELALGRPVDIAINHDANAIAMHSQNHPFTEHYCESVWDVNPEQVCRGRKVALMWLSPDCKHFSKAKGGKPVEKHIRGLAWIALRWAAKVKPRVIILENVEEFKTDKPLPTITQVDHNRLVTPFIHKYYAGNYEGGGSGASAPLDTITVEPRHAICTPFMTEFYGAEKDGTPCTEPLHTVTANNKHAGVECQIARVENSQSLGHWAEIRDMLNKYGGYSLKENEVLLLEIDGTDYFLCDIGMRMLTPRELYKAQGFPDDYKIEFDINGKPYSKKEQIARCGNAVCPPMAEAVVRANLPEYATKKPIETMRDLEKAMVA